MKLLGTLMLLSLSAFSSDLYLNFEGFSDDGGITTENTFVFEVDEDKDYDCSFSVYDEDEKEMYTYAMLQILKMNGVNTVSLSLETGDDYNTSYSTISYARSLGGIYTEIAEADGYVYSQVSVGSFEQFEIKNTIAEGVNNEKVDLLKSKRINLDNINVVTLDAGSEYKEKMTIRCSIENN